MQSTQPIGIFDSGIGGLTVANAVSMALPNEEIIYFGDTAHLPYGDKSLEAVQGYSEKIADFLLEKNCKLILIACNTASAAAYETLKKHIGNRALLMNVIDPMVEAIANDSSIKKTRHHRNEGNNFFRYLRTKIKSCETITRSIITRYSIACFHD